jgi:poly [ADP-ribose] polymerase
VVFQTSQSNLQKLSDSSFINPPGLRIAPPEAPSTHSLGNGLYFGDMFSKSAPYCQANWINSDAVLVLCEVCFLSSRVNCY